MVKREREIENEDKEDGSEAGHLLMKLAVCCSDILRPLQIVRPSNVPSSRKTLQPRASCKRALALSHISIIEEARASNDGTAEEQPIGEGGGEGR